MSSEAHGGTPPGSLRYFAVLFSQPERRPILTALYDLEASVRAAANAENHEAAHARLGWWREEIDRWLSGRARHPVTVALDPLRSELDERDGTLLRELVFAGELDLAGATFATPQHLEAYCFHAAGALQTVITCALADDQRPSPVARDFARRLGSATRQCELLRDFPADLRRGRIYLPGETLAAAGLSASVAGEDRQLEDFAGPLREWRERLLKELGVLSGLLDACECRNQRHGLVLAALHERLLHRIELSDDQNPRVAYVPPLIRLWTAWRTAIRHA